MRRRGRSFKACKWAMTLCSVVLMVLFVSSEWLLWLLVLDGVPNQYHCGVDRGRFFTFSTPERKSLNLELILGQPPGYVRPEYVSSELLDFYASVDDAGLLFAEGPLWLILLAIIIATSLLWWFGRARTPPGHCSRCGYDLTGNVSDVCSECGSAAYGRHSGEGTRGASSAAKKSLPLRYKAATRGGGKLRKACKWASAGTCLALFLSIVLNCYRGVFFHFECGTRLIVVQSLRGYTLVQWVDAASSGAIKAQIARKSGARASWNAPSLDARRAFRVKRGSTANSAEVGHFVVLLLVIVPTVLFWYRDPRQPPPGHCNCGYNLTGNESGVCPECGRAAEASRAGKDNRNASSASE